MPTTNPRIHITLDKSITILLTQLASNEHKSVAGIAKELVLEALARREDIALSAMAETRDQPRRKRIKHDDAWK